MKTRARFIFGIAAILLMASCENTFQTETGNEPDKGSDVFSATTEVAPSTKTSLSEDTNSDGSHSLFWTSGDAISISDGVSTAIYATDADNTSTAEFAPSEGKVNTDANQFVAFYPATITPSNMVLPASQNFVNKSIEQFPMRAVSSSKDLAFKNICGIIRLCLKSEEAGQIAISSICLSADKGMSGAFTVGEDNAAVVTGSNGVILNCTNPVSLDAEAATDFNITVPQGDYNPLNIKICDADGKEVNLISEGTVNVKRSQITRITLTLSKNSFETSLENIPVTDSDVNFSER